MAGTPQRLNSAQDLTLQNASIVGTNWAFDPRAFYKVNDIVVESNILFQCILDVTEQDGFFGTDNPPPSETPTHWAPISINSDNQIAASDPATRGDNTPLVTGDVYYNLTSQETFVWDGDSWEMAGASGSDIQITDDAPTARSNASALEEGDLWIDSNDGNKLYVYNGSAFVEISADTDTGSEVFIADTAPTVRPDSTAIQEGDLWYSADTDVLSYRDSSGDWTALDLNYTNFMTFVGDTAPANTLGGVGDIYIQNSSSDSHARAFWGHTGSTWLRLDSIGDGALILGDGAPTDSTTRANGVEPREGDRYYNHGTTTTNHEKHWIFESSSWRQWVNSFTITDPGGTATAYHPFETDQSLQFRDFKINITAGDGTSAPNTFNPLGAAGQEVFADRLKFSDGTNDNTYVPLNSTAENEHPVNIRPLQIGDKNYLPLGAADQSIDIHSLSIGGVGYNPVTNTTNTTINENTITFIAEDDSTIVAYDPLTHETAVTPTIKFANSTVETADDVHTVTIGSLPLTEDAWFNSNELDRSEDDVNFPSVAAVQEALDIQDFTLSSGVGTTEDPELHTITVPQIDSGTGKVVRDDDGNIATTRWRIVGSTPADVSAPTTVNSSYTQYAGVTAKTVVFNVAEVGEVFTDASFTVAQTGGTPAHTVQYIVDGGGTATDLSGNNVLQIRVTVTGYNDQVIANVRVTGAFTVAEGPASREFTNITAQVVASAAPATNVTVHYGNNANIEQYSSVPSGHSTTVEARSVNGVFATGSPTTAPRIYQMQSGVAVDFTVTPVLTGLTAKSWGFDRGQINTDDDNSDVLIDWPSFEVIPNGKVPPTDGNDHTFPAGQTVINIVLISPNTLSASYQLDSANLPGRLNYFAIDDTDNLTVTYNHNFDNPNGAYTLRRFNGTSAAFTAGSTSLTQQLTSFLAFGADSLRVRYVDSRNPTDYNIDSSTRGVAIVAPWYIWFTTDSTTPGSISQANAVTGSSGFENGQLVSDINSHVITNTAGADNLTVWAAIPLATVGSFTLGGSITTGTLVSPLGTVKWTTETLSPQTTVLSGGPGDIEYQVFQVTVIAAGNTSTINLTLS